jgi:hypothetical protein
MLTYHCIIVPDFAVFLFPILLHRHSHFHCIFASRLQPLFLLQLTLMTMIGKDLFKNCIWSAKSIKYRPILNGPAQETVDIYGYSLMRTFRQISRENFYMSFLEKHPLFPTLTKSRVLTDSFLIRIFIPGKEWVI